VVLDALRPGPTEDRIAGAAINQEPVTQATAHDPLSSSVVVPDLRHEADIEASRVETLRRTVRGSDGLAGEGRPLLTVFRRSTRRSALCAFRLTFSDAERRVIWDTLVGAIAADPATGAGGIGGWIRAIDAIGVTCIPDEQRRALVSLETALKAPLDLARRREQAIADSLRRDRARLATALLQPGLFDRRAEHTLAAQRAVLDEALARCHARLDEIARARGVVADRPRLAFAALCR